MLDLEQFDTSEAVHYHEGRFPPADLHSNELLTPLADAAAELSRFNVKLDHLVDSSIFLIPLRSKEAVVSSRIEGTISSLEDVLKFDADQDEADKTNSMITREVHSYNLAMRFAQESMQSDKKVTEDLIKNLHRVLMKFIGSRQILKGDYKLSQNYIFDRFKRKIFFVPASPENLSIRMKALLDYLANSKDHPLIKCAVSHVEFEALHPFDDGNGRVGRILITLYLWQAGVMSSPHFYVSEYFENNKSEYVDRMRAVSSHNDWTGWVKFFLEALTEQSRRKCREIEEIEKLYEEVKDLIKDVLSSKDYLTVVNFIFARPVFFSGNFVKETGLSKPSATRFLRLLREQGVLELLIQGSGRRANLFAFKPLLELLRN